MSCATPPAAREVPVPEDDDEAEEADGQSVPPGYDSMEDEDEQVAQFRLWLRERERAERRRPASRRTSGTGRPRGDEDDDGDGDDFRTNAGPPPTWDGVETPFEDYLIRVKIWANTTKVRARARGPLLLKALTKTPFQDFKHLAKDSSWLNDPDNAELLLQQMDTPEYYGDDQEEHLLASLSRVTYHLKRQKQESARQFLGRWEAAERKEAEHKVVLPAIYKGFLLINALGLSDNDIKALLNYTHGSIEPRDVKQWLRKHEAKVEAN